MAKFHEILQAYVWGRTHQALPQHIIPSESDKQLETFISFLGESPLWAVLGLADLLLPPFRSFSTSTATTKESKASASIPERHILDVVLRDADWVEDVETHARQTWGLHEDASPANSHPGWSAFALKILHGSALLPSQLNVDLDGCFKEKSEADTDKRATSETSWMGPLFALVGPASLRPAQFGAVGQEFTKIEGGSTIRPDIALRFLAPKIERILLREENKTVLVQYSHIYSLERHINVPRNHLWSITAEGIYAQAYAASYRTTDGLPTFNIVQLGNASLYAMAYTIDGRLVLSKWYSTNPQQAMDILAERGHTEIVVHQGHLIRQKLALTSLDATSFFAARTSSRSSPSMRGIILKTTAFLMRSTVDVFTRLGEILLMRSTADLILNGPRVHVRSISRVSSSTPAFHRALGEKSSFQSIKSGRVWTNNEWFIKVVTDDNEITATREVSGKRNIVDFGGVLRVTTGEHAGKTLLATRAAGERLEDGEDISDIEDMDVR
ncbi:hypothetical protein C8R44DRAFT_883979 [Mycena epipterygia]|nr:hypothetical protein C8R44DRAFT_883979 [Mycena epipterygia]